MASSDDAVQDLFVFLPYLRTSQRCEVRGIQFRSNIDLSDLPDDARRHFEIIGKMFFLQGSLRIEQMTCAYVRLSGSEAERKRQQQDLVDAHLLIAFLYSQTQPHGGVFMPFEFASLFVFQQGTWGPTPGYVPTALVWSDADYGDRAKLVDEVTVPKDELILGYDCTRNYSCHFWVAEGSRIFPEIPYQSLNLWQDIYGNLHELLSNPAHWPWARFFVDRRGRLEHMEPRIFLAIQWYARSCRAAIIAPEAIVHLGIAIETLLGVGHGEEKTERLKDAIIALLGPVPRLDSWFIQFYNARSEAVHEGMPCELNFYAIDAPGLRKLKKQKNDGQDVISIRPLIEYGRRVFRHCFESILFSAYSVKADNLGELFVHNQERLERMCRVLDDNNLSPEKKISEISASVSHLRDCSASLYPETGVAPAVVLGVAKRLMDVLLKSGAPLSTDATECARDFVMNVPEDELECFEKLKSIEALISSGADRQRWDMRVWTVLTFLQYALHAGFQFPLMFRKRQKADENG